MPTTPGIRIKQAAELLGVSDDTVRRWIESGTLTAEKDQTGRLTIEGPTLAEFARTHSGPPPNPLSSESSARNRLTGIVTAVKTDSVMAQVEMQCGPFRIVSLMSSEAVRDLGLEPGRIAVAVVKSTTVIVETSGVST